MWLAACFCARRLFFNLRASSSNLLCPQSDFQVTHRGPSYKFFFSHSSPGPLNRTEMRLLQISKQNRGGNVRTVQRLQFLFNSRRRTLSIRIWGYWRNQYGRDINLFAVDRKPCANRRALAPRTQEWCNANLVTAASVDMVLSNSPAMPIRTTSSRMR